MKTDESTPIGGVFVYIDEANLFGASRRLGYQINYKVFFRWLQQKFFITKAYIFIGYLPQNRWLYNILKNSGYEVIFKKVMYAEGRCKGNCDAEIILRMICDYYTQKPQHMILVSGDGDFECVLRFLLAESVSITLIAPALDRCSSLLKQLQIPKINLVEHYGKFDIDSPINEKAPDADVSA